MNNKICPHCGADDLTSPECLSYIDYDFPKARWWECYERQIEQLKQALIDSRRATQTWAYYPEVK